MKLLGDPLLLPRPPTSGAAAPRSIHTSVQKLSRIPKNDGGSGIKKLRLNRSFSKLNDSSILNQSNFSLASKDSGGSGQKIKIKCIRRLSRDATGSIGR